MKNTFEKAGEIRREQIVSHNPGHKAKELQRLKFLALSQIETEAKSIAHLKKKFDKAATLYQIGTNAAMDFGRASVAKEYVLNKIQNTFQPHLLVQAIKKDALVGDPYVLQAWKEHGQAALQSKDISFLPATREILAIQEPANQASVVAQAEAALVAALKGLQDDVKEAEHIFGKDSQVGMFRNVVSNWLDFQSTDGETVVRYKKFPEDDFSPEAERKANERKEKLFEGAAIAAENYQEGQRLKDLDWGQSAHKAKSQHDSIRAELAGMGIEIDPL